MCVTLRLLHKCILYIRVCVYYCRTFYKAVRVCLSTLRTLIRDILPEFLPEFLRGTMAGRHTVMGITMGIVLNIALAYLSVSIGVEWVAARRPSLPAPNGRERNASGSNWSCCMEKPIYRR